MRQPIPPLFLFFACFISVQAKLPCVLRIPSDSSKCGIINFKSIFFTTNISEFCFNKYHQAKLFSQSPPKVSPDMTLPVVENLDKVLSQMRALQCFILLDNFANVNILSYTHPVASRRLELHRSCTNKFKCSGFWVPADTISPCSLYLRKGTDSQFSSKFIQRENPTEIPYGINRKVYTSFAKPWNCQLQIYLYPPNLQSDEENYSQAKFPPIFQFHFQTPTSTNLPQDIFTINLIIYYSSQLTRYYYHSYEIWPLTMLVQHTTSFSEVRSFLLLKLVRQYFHADHFSALMADLVARIESVEIIKNSGSSSRRFSTIHIPNVVEIWPREEIFMKAFSLEHYMVQWHIPEETNTLAYIQHELRFCNAEKWLQNGRQVASDDLLGHAILHIWFSIFHNYTYKVGERWNPCLNYGGAADANPDLRLKIILNVAVNVKSEFGNVMTKRINSDVIRFVSSKSRALEQIGFYELVGYFDWVVWSALSIFILMVGFMSYFIANFATAHIKVAQGQANFRLHPYWNHVAWTAQILVEQGGIYSEQSSKIPRLRMTLGPFLLMSVVLIAAYKNDNVFRIALPRHPIPFETLEELIQENFTIYSGSKIYSMEFTPHEGMRENIH